MPNKRKKIAHNTQQLTIFSYLKKQSPPEPYSMNIDIPLRQAVSEAIRLSGKSRIDICTEIYKLTGVEVSIHSLNSWSAESRSKTSDDNGFDCMGPGTARRWGMPAEVLVAFCQVTGCWQPLFIVVESGNSKALKGKDIVRAELGRLQEEQKLIGREIKELEKALVEANQDDPGGR